MRASPAPAIPPASSRTHTHPARPRVPVTDPPGGCPQPPAATSHHHRTSASQDRPASVGPKSPGSPCPAPRPPANPANRGRCRKSGTSEGTHAPDPKAPNRPVPPPRPDHFPQNPRIPGTRTPELHPRSGKATPALKHPAIAAASPVQHAAALAPRPQPSPAAAAESWESRGSRVPGGVLSLPNGKPLPHPHRPILSRRENDAPGVGRWSSSDELEASRRRHPHPGPADCARNACSLNS